MISDFPGDSWRGLVRILRIIANVALCVFVLDIYVDDPRRNLRSEKPDHPIMRNAKNRHSTIQLSMHDIFLCICQDGLHRRRRSLAAERGAG